MTRYQTWGLPEEMDRHVLIYSGSDPVDAVNQGLDTSGFLWTFVTEDGEPIPQTEAW